MEAQEIDALLANPAVDVVVNLTMPEAHYPVSKKVLEAGKHVYSEKPFVLSLEQGEDLRRIADAKGLKRRLGAGHLSRRRASVRAPPHR
jgi:predicted dehydrogenase